MATRDHQARLIRKGAACSQSEGVASLSLTNEGAQLGGGPGHWPTLGPPWSRPGPPRPWVALGALLLSRATWAPEVCPEAVAVFLALAWMARCHEQGGSPSSILCADPWPGGAVRGRRGASCVGKQPPNRGPCVSVNVPHNHPFTQSENFRCFYTRDGIHQMLVMCLLSLSAILAPVLIAIYILQHFTLEREPTLMVPNWQN